MSPLRRGVLAVWRQCVRLAKLLFLLALIALPVPIAAFVVALVRPRRNLPAQVQKKE